MNSRTVVGLAAALAASVSLTAPSASADVPPPAPPLRVLTHNVMMLPSIVGGNYANETRAAMIASSDYVKGYDVAIFEEAFDNGPSETLKTGLSRQYPYQTPVLGRSKSGWDQTLGAYSALTPEDGGVTVVSKWPITRKVQYVYKQGCGADWFSNKGFVYVELKVNGRKVHVVGSHAQADDSLCSDAPSVRRSQFAELDAFLDGLHIPASESVVMAGDLNVVKASAEYPSMLQALDATAPAAYKGHPYSWDPKSNSLNANRYPDDAPQYLDYVLFRRGHASSTTWSNTVLTPTSPPWSSGGTTYTDHYPVAAHG
ncbi:sphingomyelin phosphodiesterase [Luteipulveratus mongoliensis]|uniref:Endonuclease/exonuclease/phosphatase domain-containing protein n=1 Tax=Luteipulveratus mongoliensis TaxID=571913 RepID=A0A0K1JFK6_9MICO|nr:sphingomyelin phosphodiesterase [Luteipulveratus mongoliensis]AKU15486.1 hypothetical protein VV02_05750 [Luteipulveratus mongoliensis]